MMRTAPFYPNPRPPARCLLLGAAMVLLCASTSGAAILSFQQYPDDFDDNMDGFLTDTEFDPAGTDGVRFTFEPTNNLVGGPRIFVSTSNGLHFGGGGGAPYPSTSRPTRTSPWSPTRSRASASS